MNEAVRDRSTPVMILNWNGWEATFSCLLSLKQAADAPVVWLVDNGSADDRSDEARAIYPDLRVLRWEENHGWAGGNNRALRIARDEGYEFAYLLNNDTVVTPGFLSAAVLAAQTNDRIAAVGSWVVYSDTGEYLEYDGEFHRPGERSLHRESGARAVLNVNGAGMLIRLRSLDDVGYFDERFFCYWEDVEWAARATQHGWILAAAAESLIYHRRGSSDLNANAAYYRARNYYLVPRRSNAASGRYIHVREVYSLLRAANDAQRGGNGQIADSLAAAAWDAWHGRFGKRGQAPPRWFSFTASRFWPLPSGTIRSRVGRLRGYLQSLNSRQEAAD